MESVVNTIFKKFRLWEMFGENTLSKSIGKASLEFAGVLKASVEWHSASGTSSSKNEVRDSMNRQPLFEITKIDDRKEFHGSEMQRKTRSLDVRSA